MPVLPPAVRRARPRLNGVLVVLVVVVAGTTLAGCGSDTSTGDKGYVDGNGVITEVAPAERKHVDDISGVTLQGKRVSLRELGRDKPVVVNVWASWCAPCRAEEGKLAAAARQLGSNVEFLGINVRDPGSKDRSLAYERRFNVSYPSIYDPSGRSLLAFPGTLSPYAIPSTLVIDRKGRVAASILGAVPSAQTVVDLVQDADK